MKPQHPGAEFAFERLATARRSGRARKRWLVLFALALCTAGAISVFAWPESDPDRLMERARSAIALKQFEQAETALRRLEQLRPPTAQDWLMRAQLAIARNRSDEARAALVQIPDSDPLAVTARVSEGYIELYAHRARAAEVAFRRVLAIDPKQPKVRRELAKLFALQGRRSELAAQYLALSELEPLSFDDAFQWCEAPDGDPEPAESAAALERYVKADPDDRWSRLSLAENLRKLGRLAEAESVLSALPKTDVESQVARARLARDRGDNPAAEDLLSTVPNTQAEAARLRGELALARHDAAAATQFFRAAQTADPDHRDTLFGLGQALRLSGKDDEAKPLLQAAWARDKLAVLLERALTPDGRKEPRVLRQLGACCADLSCLPEARAWFKLAIAADPLDPESQKALFRLGEQKPARATSP
jgi:predicted Zn-dependent protease